MNQKLLNINEKFAESRGWVIKTGKNFNGYKPLTPYFLVDAAFQEWNILKRDFTFIHEDRQYATRLSNAFASFLNSFRLTFSSDEYDYLLDLTDEFENMIPHHLLVARIAFMNVVANFLDFDRQKPIASLWIINMLAVAAQGYWGLVTPKNRGLGTDRQNPEINSMLANTKKLAESYFQTEGRLVDEKYVNNLQTAMQTLINQIALWLNSKNED